MAKVAYFKYRLSDGSGLGYGWVPASAWEDHKRFNPNIGFCEISIADHHQYRGCAHRFHFDGNAIQPKRKIVLTSSKFKLRAGTPAQWKVIALTSPAAPLYTWGPEVRYDIGDVVAIPDTTDKALQLITGYVTGTTLPPDLEVGKIVTEPRDFVEFTWALPDEDVTILINSNPVGVFRDSFHLINSGGTRDLAVEIDAGRWYSDTVIINSYEGCLRVMD